MSIISDAIRTDKEYRELLHCAKLAFSAVKPLRIAAGGLCDGASDAAVISLIEDLKKERRGAALIVCPEEKQCVRARETLERFGLRAAFFGAALDKMSDGERMRHLDAVILQSLVGTLGHLREKGGSISPDTQSALEYLAQKLN